jgi:hypothetical protein
LRTEKAKNKYKERQGILERVKEEGLRVRIKYLGCRTRLKMNDELRKVKEDLGRK